MAEGIVDQRWWIWLAGRREPDAAKLAKDLQALGNENGARPGCRRPISRACATASSGSPDGANSTLDRRRAGDAPVRR